MFQIGVDEEELNSPSFATFPYLVHNTESPKFGEAPCFPNPNPIFLSKPQPQPLKLLITPEEKEEFSQLQRAKILSDFQSRINSLVLVFKNNQTQLLSVCFCHISSFSSSLNHQLLALGHTSHRLELSLRRISRLVAKRTRLQKQVAFNRVSIYSTLYKLQMKKDRRFESVDSCSYFETLLKENEDNDNTHVLEIENTHLKKQLLREEREQNTFVDSLNQLLDRYDVHVPTQGHRPYMTSFGSSPQPLEGRRKFTSNAGEKPRLKPGKKP